MGQQRVRSSSDASLEAADASRPASPRLGVPTPEQPFPKSQIEAYLASHRRRLNHFRRTKRIQVEIVGEGGSGLALIEHKLARERRLLNEREVGDEWFEDDPDAKGGLIDFAFNFSMRDSSKRRVDHLRGKVHRRHRRATDGAEVSELPQLRLDAPSNANLRQSANRSLQRVYSNSLVESPTGSAEALDHFSSDGGELSATPSRLDRSRPSTPSLSRGPSEQANSTLGLATVVEHDQLLPSSSSLVSSVPSPSVRSRSPAPSEGEFRPPPLRRTGTASTILTIDSTETKKEKRRRRERFKQTFKRGKRASASEEVQKVLRRRAAKMSDYLRGRTATAGLNNSSDEFALEAALKLQPEEGRVEVVRLIEHQRGSNLFHRPRFSAAALFHADPGPWGQLGRTGSKAARKGRVEESPFTPATFGLPLPEPTWEWVDPDWTITKTGEVDEHGWSYATRFRSKRWKAKPGPLSFVRRREHTRARRFTPPEFEVVEEDEAEDGESEVGELSRQTSVVDGV